jgi:hypothetical protein
MDKLKNYIDALRVVARQPSNFDAQPLAEQRINEYLQSEVAALSEQCSPSGRERKTKNECADHRNPMQC